MKNIALSLELFDRIEKEKKKEVKYLQKDLAVTWFQSSQGDTGKNRTKLQSLCSKVTRKEGKSMQ